ncbi:MAG: aminoacyl-tRNA hydrolase, partial [SAR202 cluster bacterium]|nr:aminoacyl-tRNA hydrolase [SAR202 cluster bacterium]
TSKAALPSDVRQRLAALAGRRLTAAGVLVIRAERHRTQPRNRADAMLRLVELLRQATRPPKPRRATKPPRAAKEARLRGKALRGRIKRLRGPAASDD